MCALRPASWLIASLIWSFACGTLLYPERRDLEPDRLDPVVVLMDGALLFVFVIPGVIAFAVDIATGAIYEPEDDRQAKWTLRRGGDPVRLTASQARRLELRLPSEAATWRPDAVWWETEDGARLPTRSVSSGPPGHYRLECQLPHARGPHRLVVTGIDGTRHAVPVIVL